jgi:tRNA pseudouridine55 synthase
VRTIKRRVRVKVGHLGTLDPFASGLLPICLGEATKIAQFLNTADKTYTGVIRLGQATDTGDRTGQVIRTAPLAGLRAEALRDVERRFIGRGKQVPPMYSALKRDGVPLYKLARQGVEVEREPREVHIYTLQLAAVDAERLSFAVACSKGTYVRVLAEDIGTALGSVAHLESLRRTHFGHFDLSMAITPDDWRPDTGGGVVSVATALSHLARVTLDAPAVTAVRRGQSYALGRLTGGLRDDVALLVDAGGEAVAVIVRADGRWAFGRVLSPA